jgi:zinc/manganese transport system substrate-binding protein
MASVFSRLSALSLLVGLVACGAPNASDNNASQSKGIKVVSTFLPITLFTEAVAGECAEVTSLIPPNLGPHDFQATPSTLTALSGAKVLVKNGLGMEEFLEDLISSADNKNLVVIDTSSGVETIKAAGGGHHGDEHHDDDHGHGHSHGEYDPHIWLDPVRAAQQVENIRDGLVKADPSCADGYKKNAAQYTAKLKELNTEFTAKLKPYSGKTFVAFHDFATYFANRYSLKAEFLVDLPEMNPSPADLQRVAAQVKASGLKALLSEPQEGNRSFNALAKDLGVNIVVFNPLETGSAESAKVPATYFEVMRSNVNNLVKAIGD